VITRRKFLHRSSLATTALLMNRLPGLHQAPAVKPLTINTSTLAKFVDPLPIPPTIQPVDRRASPANPSVTVPCYRAAMRAFEMKVHRDLKPTQMWGFGSGFPGPTFDVRSGQEIMVEWANELPDKHFLPIDHNLSGAGKDQPEVRTVVHLHGGKVAPESDGFPEDWMVPGKSAT
jgi:spore coat protein A